MQSSDNQLVYGEMIVVLLSHEAAGTMTVGGDRVVHLCSKGSVCERTQDEEAILLPPDPL